eukprot:m.422192 g.422192  ORF g.422192 m.422192 type:complete len:59 (-) comp16852_c0_seq5:2160-2336(-)
MSKTTTGQHPVHPRFNRPDQNVRSVGHLASVHEATTTWSVKSAAAGLSSILGILGTHP